MPAKRRSPASKATLAAAEATYGKASEKLSAGRRRAAKALDAAVQAELPPLKLERARFITEIVTDPDNARCRRHRSRGVLGADQPRHQGRPDDEGGVRR